MGAISAGIDTTFDYCILITSVGYLMNFMTMFGEVEDEHARETQGATSHQHPYG